jgi:hypothetical protein
MPGLKIQGEGAHIACIDKDVSISVVKGQLIWSTTVWAVLAAFLHCAASWRLAETVTPMSHYSDVTLLRCHATPMSRYSDVTLLQCHSLGLSHHIEPVLWVLVSHVHYLVLGDLKLHTPLGGPYAHASSVASSFFLSFIVTTV